MFNIERQEVPISVLAQHLRYVAGLLDKNECFGGQIGWDKFATPAKPGHVWVEVWNRVNEHQGQGGLNINGLYASGDFDELGVEIVKKATDESTP